nr:hypothetical protein [Secundilactobacillus paracollinoides]
MTALHYGEDYPGYPQNSQTMCQLPDPRFIVLEIDGLRSDDETFSVKQVDKNLNLKTGLLSEIYEITSPTDKTVRLTMQTFASQDDARIYGVAYSLSALNFSGNVKVIKQHRYTQQQIPQHDIDVRNVQRQSQLTCTYQEADHPTMQMITRKSQLAITLQVQPLKNDDQPVPKLTTQDQLPTYVTDFDLVPALPKKLISFIVSGFHTRSSSPMPIRIRSTKRWRTKRFQRYSISLRTSGLFFGTTATLNLRGTQNWQKVSGLTSFTSIKLRVVMA